MLRIYTASRFHRGDMWLDIQEHEDFNHLFHARWLQHWKRGTKETPERAFHFWQENLEDIETADLVLLFSAPGDIQGGALVEVGAALAMDKLVYVCGKNEAHRSWIYHPKVRRYETLPEALKAIDIYNDFKIEKTSFWNNNFVIANSDYHVVQIPKSNY